MDSTDLPPKKESSFNVRLEVTIACFVKSMLVKNTRFSASSTDLRVNIFDVVRRYGLMSDAHNASPFLESSAPVSVAE